MQFHQLKHFAHGERRHAASVQLCPSPLLGRRRFMLGTAAALAVGCLPAEANVPVPYDWNAAPPMDDKLSFIEWMVRREAQRDGTGSAPERGDPGRGDRTAGHVPKQRPAWPIPTVVGPRCAYPSITEVVDFAGAP
jgi:hypothetical protein